MRPFYVVFAALFATTGAIADEPAVEREFSEIATDGCRNRDGDFIVRGMVSNANENTMVLVAPYNSRSTLSVSLPGRGPFARVRGFFAKSREERVDEMLNDLRDTGTVVVVTLKCKGNATPVARSISFRNADGSEGSIAY